MLCIISKTETEPENGEKKTLDPLPALSPKKSNIYDPVT